MIKDKILREQLLQLLDGRNAHLNFDDAVNNFPAECYNVPAPNVSYTPWHLLEHIRIAQSDILDFIRNPEYEAPNWPDDYWPELGEQADKKTWGETVTAIRTDLDELKMIVEDESNDLTAELPHASGYTILREILVVSDHNAFHIGEFAILRQVMDTWGR